MALGAEDIFTTTLWQELDAGAWTEGTGIILDHTPFSFEGREYEIDPMNCDARNQCARKGAQVGWTSINMLKSIHGSRFGRYRKGVAYYFPTTRDVSDFVKGRFNPLIDDNPDQIGRYIRNTDSTAIKQIADSMLYFRGMKSRSQAKPIPVDRIVFDELDEMDPAMVDLAEERFADSKLKERSDLSTPTIPDYGIDLRWQRSDQRLWMIRCEKRNRHTCLEKEFEDHGWLNQRVLIPQQGRIIRACIHCGGEIFPRNGQWVASYPSRSTDLVGWWISQLNSPRVTPASFLAAFQEPKRTLRETYNSKVGMPWIEAENRLSVQEVLDCCSNAGVASSDRGPCSMGVDQGKGLHVVIGKPHASKQGEIVHLGEYLDWNELDRLMKIFHVSRCVVDSLPETRNALAFADRHPGKVFLSFYNEHQKGRPKWDEKAYTVSVNRRESLDLSHQQISNKQIVLPKECDITRTFATHCHNAAKKLEEDEETGSKRYVYIKLGPDHFRHAFNYECMARNEITGMAIDLERIFH